MTDSELISRFKEQGDEQAFARLYERYFAKVAKFVAWSIGDFEKGKDVAQSIFVKIYERPQLIDTTKSFKTWLYVVAKNQSKNIGRNLAVRHEHHLKIAHSLESSTSTIVDDQAKKINEILEMTNELSKHQKEVFLLKYVNNLTIEEIAQVCDCSSGTVKSRLFYSIKNLKQKIGQI